ncbi:MAG TPA: tetratricopeptide repeat protein [Vicinamibacterales bacterium]|nr:tetratricopeptide repeat protein [Vicinamibacterales bacterium]
MSWFPRARLRTKAGLFTVYLVTLASAPFIGACTRQQRPPDAAAQSSGTDRPALPPASLPDLSQLDPAARQQITERYRSLTSLVAAPGTRSENLAEAYGSMGNLLLAAELFEAAEPFYRHAQALQSSEFRWPYYLGHIYQATSQPDKAVASFARAVELRPNDVAALIWLGNLYLAGGTPELAEPLFTRALSVQPGTIAAMYGLGQTALAKQDHARAVEYFERVLASDARATVVHYPLALAYRALGDTARAEQHLRLRGTVEVGPPDPLMVELRGLLQGANAEEARGTRALSARDFPAAVKHFRAAVALAPDDPALHHKLGTALSLAGDTKGALQQFKEAVHLLPTFAEAHYSLGVLLDSLGQPGPAIEHLSAAVRLGPNYISARLQLADVLARNGQLERSLAQYRQALDADSQSADARFGYGLAFARLGRYTEAREVLSEGARLHPEQSRFAEMVTRVDAARRARP